MVILVFHSLFYLCRQYLTLKYIFLKRFKPLKKQNPYVLCTNFGRGVNLFNSALLCRVVDFKGAQLEFYRILIGVHAKVLLDPKDLKP